MLTVMPCHAVQGNYLEAECVDVDPSAKIITCQYNKPFRGQSDISGRTFQVPYDVLVVAVSMHCMQFSPSTTLLAQPFTGKQWHSACVVAWQCIVCTSTVLTAPQAALNELNVMRLQQTQVASGTI